jgi:plastocyanin
MSRLKPTAATPVRWTAEIVATVLACMAAAGTAWAAAQSHQVEQKGRMFAPNKLEVRKGETIRIVNNDEDLLHHAYIDSPGMKYDSGEQEPGTYLDIPFTKAGTYQVLCGIHPKMRLEVTVK